MTLTSQELATVLAALREWQIVAEPKHQSTEHFDDVEPLTVDEIDALCERLNVIEERDGLTVEKRVSLRDMARAIYADGSDDDIEVDDAPEFSVCENGAWVSAWVFVANEEDETCQTS